LGCHQRAFQFFGGVPQRGIVDNAKCAITRARWREPEVQRAYAELAEGYGFKISACPPADPQKNSELEVLATTTSRRLRSTLKSSAAAGGACGARRICCKQRSGARLGRASGAWAAATCRPKKNPPRAQAGGGRSHWPSERSTAAVANP
jgi:hypothetical protein